MFDRILVASDVLDACDAAVLTAAKLAERSDGSLFLLHVLESSYTGKYRHFVKRFDNGAEIVSGTEYEGVVRDQILNTCAKPLAALNRCEVRVTAGFPFEKILEWARDTSADLIVIGPHSERGALRGVSRYRGRIGTTVEGVIQRARCVVMVVNQPLPADHQCFKEIMVCIDFSASCRYALQLAVLLAEVHHSRLHIFHMLPLPTATRCPQDELERQIGDLTEQLKRFCRESSLELDAKFTVWEGTNPHQEILKYARDKGIDLIAMGSHTKEKANKWYVGSAVEQVSSRALCPVAIVTDPKSVLKLIK